MDLGYFSSFCKYFHTHAHHLTGVEGVRSVKSTGIVRRVDELGRIVLPIEMRRTLNIGEKDSLEIYVDGDSIILRKYQSACIFCESTKKIVSYRGKNVCPDCIAKLKELY